MFGDRGRDVDSIADANGFSGVVRVDRRDDVEFARAYGLAHRGYGIPNTVETQFGIASGTKGLTALTVVSLIEEGVLELSTTARSVLGDDLPLIDDDVTVEHLLAHRSGIGDYLDEDADARDHRLRHAGSRPRARDDRGVPRGARRPRHRFAAGRAVRLLQRRLRRARADRRAGERRAVPRARATSASASRRACTTPRSCAPTSCRGARRSATSTIDGAADQRAPPAGARQRRRRDLLHRGGHQRLLDAPCSPAGSSRGLGRGDGAAAQRRAGRAEALRTRLLAPRVERRRDAGGLRRGRLVPERARPARR